MTNPYQQRMAKMQMIPYEGSPQQRLAERRERKRQAIVDQGDIPLTQYEGRPWVDTPEEAMGPDAWRSYDMSPEQWLDDMDELLGELVRLRRLESAVKLITEVTEIAKDVIAPSAIATRLRLALADEYDTPGADDEPDDVAQHEEWLATEGADHLFEGHGE